MCNFSSQKCANIPKQRGRNEKYVNVFRLTRRARLWHLHVIDCCFCWCNNKCRVQWPMRLCYRNGFGNLVLQVDVLLLEIGAIRFVSLEGSSCSVWMRWLVVSQWRCHTGGASGTCGSRFGATLCLYVKRFTSLHGPVRSGLLKKRYCSISPLRKPS